ncbi:hypothetical protein [Peloplasma aerotolerans]|uniref:Glycosyl hydrolase family 32 N-terminal domain-containing protein n=1 Tax=Peloplasma aerotolerans TaxID=3044389 RepID=A0AAW6UCW9_9MOLU|nr:hypothetical protein [Mariniplasma sp. M4Ah]MDI6452818.1 hypothetical protein [Mariniplasma sp. M4Ah]
MKSDFFKEGFFDWQSVKRKRIRDKQKYNEKLYWGDFTREYVDESVLPNWAIGPFDKHDQPVFEPSKEAWDVGHISGGVHNGSIIKHQGYMYYIYRGEMPHELVTSEEDSSPIEVVTDYICDIGVARSLDGINFERVAGPLFRNGDDEDYSFEDVNCVKYDDTFYLFCNRWNFHEPLNTKESGVVVSTSKDLIEWSRPKLVFGDSNQIHRNACVVQSPDNEAVKINGKFVMYLNNFIIAYSSDLVNWTSNVSKHRWPGGEGCFALSNHRGDDIVLFTGGHHSGHFYAIGEVLFSHADVTKPITWLERPVLKADQRSYENGYDYLNPKNLVSNWRDTVFFTGMTMKNEKWMMYYGGSEYYTCLAMSKVKKDVSK